MTELLLLEVALPHYLCQGAPVAQTLLAAASAFHRLADCLRPAALAQAVFAAAHTATQTRCTTAPPQPPTTHNHE